MREGYHGALDALRELAVLGEASPRNQAVLERLGASMVPFAPSALLSLIRGCSDELQQRLAQPKRIRRRTGIHG